MSIQDSNTLIENYKNMLTFIQHCNDRPSTFGSSHEAVKIGGRKRRGKIWKLKSL